MEKQEIEKKIETNKNEIEKLQGSQESYKKMLEELKKAVEELNNAKRNAEKSFSDLKNHLQSTSADRQIKEYEREYNNICDLISKINNEIIPACNSKLNSIGTDLTTKSASLERLSTDLKNAEKK